MKASTSGWGHAARSLTVFTLSLGATWMGMHACGSQRAARPDPAIASVAAVPSVASKAAAHDAPIPPCRARQAKRTFVGFAEGAGLKSFEASAEQASRILAMLEARLCDVSDAQDRSGSLRAAGTRGVLSITALHFTSVDLRTAQAQVELAGAEEPSRGSTPPRLEPRTWVVDVAHDEQDWQIVRAVPR